jgi:hypothetical protein
MGRTSLGGGKSEISSLSEQRLKAKKWSEQQKFKSPLPKSPLPVRKAATPGHIINKKSESAIKRPATPILMNRLKRNRNNNNIDDDDDDDDSNVNNYTRSPKKEKRQSINEPIVPVHINSYLPVNNVSNEKKVNHDAIAEQRLKARKWAKEQQIYPSYDSFSSDDEKLSHDPVIVPLSSILLPNEKRQDHKTFQRRFNQQDGPFTLTQTTISEINTKVPIVDLTHHSSQSHIQSSNDNGVLSSQLLISMEPMEPAEYNEFSDFLDNSGLLGDGESDVDIDVADNSVYDSTSYIEKNEYKEISHYDDGYIVLLDYVIVIGLITMSIGMFIYGCLYLLSSLSIIDTTSDLSHINKQLIEFSIQKSNELNQYYILPILVFIEGHGMKMIVVSSLLVICTWICILFIRYLRFDYNL